MKQRVRKYRTNIDSIWDMAFYFWITEWVTTLPPPAQPPSVLVLLCIICNQHNGLTYLMSSHGGVVCSGPCCHMLVCCMSWFKSDSRQPPKECNDDIGGIIIATINIITMWNQTLVSGGVDIRLFKVQLQFSLNNKPVFVCSKHSLGFKKAYFFSHVGLYSLSQ